jgi:hypothetical protein
MCDVQDEPTYGYWRQVCDLSGNCGFVGCDPPERRRRYYNDAIPVTWGPNSREEELVKQLEKIPYQILLLDGMVDNAKGCSCEHFNCSHNTMDPTIAIAISKLVEEFLSLEDKFNDLLKACVESLGMCYTQS